MYLLLLCLLAAGNAWGQRGGGGREAIDPERFKPLESPTSPHELASNQSKRRNFGPCSMHLPTPEKPSCVLWETLVGAQKP